MSGVPKSRRKKHDFETPHKLRALRKTITELAINDFGYDKERLELKAYKRLLDKGIMPLDDIVQAYRSWMGAYVRLMSKIQVKHMKELFKSLFGKEPTWKQLSDSKTAARLRPKKAAAAS